MWTDTAADMKKANGCYFQFFKWI